MVWSGSQYLLVGRLPSTTRSYVWTSSDGHVWAQRLYGPDTTYLHPIWSGTLFVLLDNKGNVSTSPTGANWTTQNISASGLNEVAWSGTEYLITQWTTVYTSPDAVTWTPHSITPSLSHVIWAGNRFIAAGGTGTTQIFSSPDGLNWTLETTDGNGGINDLAWSGNQAVAGAGASFWTQSCTIPTADFRFNPAAPLRNQPVAFFDLSSANPTSWSWDFGDGQGSSQQDPTHTYGQGGVYSVSLAATNAFGTDSTQQQITVSLPTSPCSPWEWDAPVASPVNAATYGNGQWVAVGNSGWIGTSPDGVTWTQQTSPVTTKLLDVIWTGSQYMAVGFAGTILTSPDGVTWQASNSISGVYDLYSVVWSGSQYLLVGRLPSTTRSYVWTSSDGHVWAQRLYGPDTTYLHPIWSGTLFVLLDNKGNVSTSPTGANWTTQNISASGLNEVAWSGTEYLITQWTTVYTSPDAVTWTPHSITPSLSHVIWAGNRFIAAGGTGTTQIFSSPDGLNWTLETTDGNGGINDLAWSGKELVAGGGAGAIGTQGCNDAVDLQVTGPSVSSTSPEPGSDLVVYMTASNLGTDPSNATTLVYYRSSDAVISSADTEIGQDSISSLAGGASSPQNLQTTAPSSDGTYWFGACILPTGDESNVSNNCSTGVEVDVVSHPDLVVIDPSVDNAAPAQGQQITIHATAKNSGIAASAATNLTYYLSPDPTITSGDTSLGQKSVPALSPNGTYPDSLQTTAPPATGNYWLGACVQSVSGETNVSNNCSTGVEIQVGPACTDDEFELLGSDNSDDTCYGASVVPGVAQQHLHCDEDWVRFVPDAGATYRIETSSLTGGADTTLALHQDCGQQQLAFNDNFTGLASRIDWTATGTAPIDIRIQERAGTYATGEGYTISVSCIAGCAPVPIFADGFEDGTLCAWSNGGC